MDYTKISVLKITCYMLSRVNNTLLTLDAILLVDKILADWW